MANNVTIDYRITFFVKKQRISPKILIQLTRLAKKFSCFIYIDNITQKRCSDLSHSLGLHKAGLIEGDFCQLISIGIDAELANFVLTDLLASSVDLIASDKHVTPVSALMEKIFQRMLSCKVTFHYIKTQESLSKFDVLKEIAQQICVEQPDKLLLNLIKREERSSTIMKGQIALPHVISPLVKAPTIATVRSDTLVDWNSQSGGVKVIIGLVLPQDLTKEMMKAATQLSRNLLSDSFCYRIVATRQSAGLQALLLYAMYRDLD